MDDVSFGIALGLKRSRDGYAEAAAIEAQMAADEAGNNADILTAVGLKMAAMQNRIAELEQQLALSDANAKGCSAQAKALLDENPNTGLRGDSGVAYKSKAGNKSKLRRIYEEAFDTAARERGIQNPEQHRID